MSGHLTPHHSPAQPPPVPANGPPPPALQQWGPADAGSDGSGIKLSRYFAAIYRFKWLVLGILVVGTGIGIGATHLLEPEYEARATIWVASETPQGKEGGGPVRTSPVVGTMAWDDLLRSFVVLDNAVIRERLYLRPVTPRDSGVFTDFGVGAGFRPGSYVLTVDGSGTRYTLGLEKGTVVEYGAVGDSIGRAVGLKWAPSAAMLGRGRTIRFEVVPPRAISVGLLQSISTNLPDRTNLLSVSLRGRDPQRAAATLNTLLNQFVATAVQLKNRHLVSFTQELGKQVTYAEDQMRAAEVALQSYRANTITEARDDITIIPGLGTSPSPAISNYFNLKVQADNLRAERDALERAIAQARAGTIAPTTFLALPTVQAQTSSRLRQALDSLTVKEAQLRALSTVYTDSHPSVRNVRQSIDRLRQQDIPNAAGEILTIVRATEQEVDQRVRAQTTDIKQIPARSIREASLQRDLNGKAALFTMLQNRYEEAKLAEASVQPDVAVLDTAVAPSSPTSNSAPSIIVLAVLVSAGAGLGVALLLDLSDKRLRYPEQAMHELGLTIIGAVPTIRQVNGGKPDPTGAAQVVEAFRTIRLGLTHAYDSARPVQMTITSPGAGEGKSLIASNLALSFAEAGYRTLLVDGDIRRGELHAMFAVNRRPGLIDYLVGSAGLDTVVRVTAHENLTLIPCGSRRHRGPELLGSPLMSKLVSEMRLSYDVIIVDSPPLAAGVDPFVLGTATGNMLLVLRSGETDRKLAHAKLELLDRLPVRLLGAVLNDIQPQGEYKYYTYLYGYSTAEDESIPQLTSRVGEIRRA
jgi:succinoglycan biosynthesis transport protein ExoP